MVQACAEASGAIQFYVISFIIPFVTVLWLCFKLQSESFHCFLSTDPSALASSIYYLTHYKPCVALELHGKMCNFHPENQLTAYYLDAPWSGISDCWVTYSKYVRESYTDNFIAVVVYNSMPTSCSQHLPGGRDAAVFAGCLPTVHFPNRLFQVFLS